MNDFQRTKAARAIQFDALEGRALLAASITGPVAVAPPPAQVAAQQVDDGINVKKDDFEVDPGDTSYDLTFVSGRYKFTNNYDLDIDERHNADDDGTGISAVDAMTVFFDRLSSRLGLQAGLTAHQQSKQLAAQQVEGDYGLSQEKFKLRAGVLTYKLEITSGQYEFDQSYTMNLKRDNRGPNDGVTAVDAVGIFMDRLFTHVDDYLAGSTPED